SVFAKGDRKTIAGSDEEQFSAFERNYNGHTLLTLINVSDEANNVTVKTSFKEGEVLVDAYNNDKEYVVLKDGEVAIELAGMQEGGTAILAPKGLDEELDKEDDNNNDNPSIDDDNNNSSNNNGNGSNNNGTTSNGDGTKTGDSNTGIVVFVSIMFLSAGLIVFLRKKRA
ncbi:MAG: LPXTG cell wall anchor domain-containing protein, partial [Clostridium sp.]|nr:LPXTG cell wall anchor domain-containing protein [Clostridium sp.]